MMKRVAIFFVFMLVTPATVAAEFQAPALPFVDTAARAAIEKEYRAAATHKALAMTETGRWSVASAAPNVEFAAARALTLCQEAYPRFPCFVAAENDRIVVRERYTPEAIHARAIELMKRANLRLDYYADENRDGGVAPTKQLRTRDVHAPTPLTVPGAKTVTTIELTELLIRSRPTLINVLPWREGTFAIPGTTWIQGMGRQLSRGEMEELRSTLAKIAPDRNAPLVLYCLSWECWLSYNAALNAMELGYTNVLWYRGGGEAWDHAALPLVRSTLYKQL